MAAAVPTPAQPTTAGPPPSLSLPPSQFARLQPHAYLLAHLSPPASSNQPSIRANGRYPTQFRSTSANTGSLTHTNGSAVVRIGDTAAVCGVRAQILHTEDIASWSVSSASSGVANKRRKLVSSDSEGPGSTQRLDNRSDVAEVPNNNDDENDDEDKDEDKDESQIQDLSLLVPNLSLSTGCAPGFIPGAPPSALAQSLSHQILTLLHSSRLVRADDLRIWHETPDLESGEPIRHNESEAMDVDEEQNAASTESRTAKREIKAFWVLYIDIMIISLAGNPFDAAWAAVLAALRDVKLPRAWWDVDSEMVLCSEDAAEAQKLSLRGMPVACSFCVFEADAAAGWRAVVIPDADQMEGDLARGAKGTELQRRWTLADPDGYEESLCHERVCLVVDRRHAQTMIIRMEKNGGWTVGKQELRQLLDVAAARWEEMKKVLAM